MIPKPLNGITVVEMGNAEAEGIASLLLSDYGAEVIRLEIEFPDETEKKEKTDFRICDRGKRRILFHPENVSEREWLKELLSDTDAVISSFPEEILKQWGMDGRAMQAVNQRLVYTSITGYGQEGPYGHCRPYNEITVQAESGLMSITGPEHGEPVRCGSDFATFSGGANACIATLMALIDVRKTGQGRRNDVSMMDSILYGLENQFSIYLKSSHIPVPMGNHYALSAPVGDFLCKDGKKVMISVATEVQWKNFAEVMGHIEWLDDPAYRNVGERLKNYKKLENDVAGAFMERTSDEALKQLQSKNCIYGKINNFEDVVRHPQVAVRHIFMDVRTPDGEKMRAPSNPLIMDGEKPAKNVIGKVTVCQKNMASNNDTKKCDMCQKRCQNS